MSGDLQSFQDESGLTRDEMGAAMMIVLARLLTLARTIDVPDRIVLEMTCGQLRALTLQVLQWEASLDEHTHPVATRTLVRYLLEMARADTEPTPRGPSA